MTWWHDVECSSHVFVARHSSHNIRDIEIAGQDLGAAAAFQALKYCQKPDEKADNGHES